jgi:simple sugar transport system permease protein
VWAYLWHTPFGYELRTVGQSEKAAIYAGVKLRRVILVAMCLSGALAGFVGVNEIMGVHHRLLLNFNLGYGFTGIAVALLGRNHPVGVLLAALLFGAFLRGALFVDIFTEHVSKDLVLVLQGVIILFVASEALFRGRAARLERGKV